MTPLNQPDPASKALENRIAKLEQALQVSANRVVLQTGMAKITITNNGIVLESSGNIQLTAGANTQIQSGGSTEMKSAGKLIMKASQILQN